MNAAERRLKIQDLSVFIRVHLRQVNFSATQSHPESNSAFRKCRHRVLRIGGLVPACKSSRNHSLTVVARKLLLSRARKKVRKNRPQAAEAGETARPNARNTG